MVGAKLAFLRKNWQGMGSNALIVLLGCSLIVTAIYLELPQPTAQAQVVLGSEIFTFNPLEVTTLRPDLFKPGHFSMFDILAYLDAQGQIDMEYHFETNLSTHVIESIDGDQNWWYHAYYSGGHIERNTYRMDHYLWKEESYLELYQENPNLINDIYDTFREETSRLTNNSGIIIIPRVIIEGNTFYQEFYNVTITPHNLRNDTLQPNIVTAIDVILNLGDSGLLTYELQWYDSLGTATVVRSYWVERINSDATIGRCGFTYETGDTRFEFGGGNLIHIPSDMRILNSPEYIHWAWKCL